VLVEALERIVSYENKLISDSGARHAAVRLAREALAAWRARQTEVVAPAPTVGYSREQMLDIFCEGAITRGEMAEAERYLATLISTLSVPVPAIDELAEAVYQDNTALLTNVEARYIAKVIHALLTKGRGGV